MYLTRLLYFSECNPELDPCIERILSSARTRNEVEEVSGALWFDGKFFIQALEGQRLAVSRIYHRIAADPRHCNIELVACEAIDTRLFGEWSMGYLAATKRNWANIFKFSGHRELKPREMSPESMLKFLLALEHDD